jgi:hypothetical protein
MDSRRKLEYDFAKADIETVSALLKQCDPVKDAMTRSGLEARLEQAQQNLRRLKAAERSANIGSILHRIFQEVTARPKTFYYPLAAAAGTIIGGLIALRILFGN